MIEAGAITNPGDGDPVTTCSSRRFLLAVALFLATGIASLPAARAPFDPKRNPHAHFREAGSCPKCHVFVDGKPDPGRFLPESDDFCTGCHTADELGRSHPVRVRPRDKYREMKVPGDFRLDDGGRMMCLTCHTAHGPFFSAVKAYEKQRPENPNAAAGTPLYYRTYFARRSDPKLGFAPLCDDCHKDL